MKNIPLGSLLVLTIWITSAFWLGTLSRNIEQDFFDVIMLYIGSNILIFIHTALTTPIEEGGKLISLEEIEIGKIKRNTLLISIKNAFHKCFNFYTLSSLLTVPCLLGIFMTSLIHH